MTERITEKKVERYLYPSLFSSLSIIIIIRRFFQESIIYHFIYLYLFLIQSAIMRMTLFNTILCLFIVLMGIALSSSSSIDNDDNAAANLDWNDFDSYYPTHFPNARAAKSRFWKRAPQRKFWKRSVLDSEMNTNNIADSKYNQVQQQEKH